MQNLESIIRPLAIGTEVSLFSHVGVQTLWPWTHQSKFLLFATQKQNVRNNPCSIMLETFVHRSRRASLTFEKMQATNLSGPIIILGTCWSIYTIEKQADLATQSSQLEPSSDLCSLHVPIINQKVFSIRVAHHHFVQLALEIPSTAEF